MNEGPIIPPVNQQAKTCGLAIWSLVLGILGLGMCLSLFAGIPGVICGHKALRRIDESGGLLKGKGLAIGGLVTGYMAIAFSIITIPMAYLFTHPLSKESIETREEAPQRSSLQTSTLQSSAPQTSTTQEAIPQSAKDANVCIKNLRQIEGAKTQWAMEKHKGKKDIPTAADLDIYTSGNGFSSLQCPAGGTYTINAVDTNPTCSVPGHALNASK